MKRFSMFSFSIASLLLFTFSYTEDPTEKVVAGFKKYLQELPQEKVYLHFDRPYYASGETIWFKSYLVAGPHHEASPLSRTIYVELLNEKQQLVARLKQLAIDGWASGHIDLPDTLQSGNYLVRAYTNWMKNFNESYFFHRTVKIWNVNNHTSGSGLEDATSIQFFPEGGDLVNGIHSKVGFKAIGADGLGKEVAGKIIDDQNNAVAEFKSNFLGMGVFTFVPMAGKKYTARVNDVAQSWDLPTPKSEGVVLSVTNQPEQAELTVRIQTTDYKRLQSLYLLGQSRGMVAFSAKILLTSNLVYTKIKKDQLREGVTQITVVDAEGLPLCERLVYIEKATKPLSIELKSDKDSYQPREKISLTIETTSEEGKPVPAHLSLAVCDNQQILIDGNQENIYAYLYLSSELRGHIESPGYYFNSNNKDRHTALDLLLLTQGWRRFTIAQALNGETTKPGYAIETGLTVKGKMVDKFNNKPIANGKVTYLALDPMFPTALSATTNGAGEFEINNIIYFDTARAVLQGETRRGQKWVKFLIDSIPQLPAIQFPVYTLQGTMDDYQRDFIAKSLERKRIDEKYNLDEKVIILNELEIKGEKDDPLKRDRIYGKAGTSVQVAGDLSMEVMVHPLQLLQGRVAGVQVSGSGMNWQVLIRGVGSINSGNEPLFLVDNVPVDIAALSSLAVRDIESFDVWKGAEAAMFGVRGANGVIAFYTRRGSGIVTPVEGIFNFGKMGYLTEREFYSPQYDVAKAGHIKPDKRITLFWAPNIQTDSTGRATVSFYNHDLETTVTGIIEGMTLSGNAGASTIQYSIKNK